MQTITVSTFYSTGLHSDFASISTIEIEDKPFASGGFGDVYFCSSINGKVLKIPQVVKVFKNVTSGNAEKSYETIKRLQERIKVKNQDLINQNKPPISNTPAFKAIPQFSYEGVLNAKKVFGYSASRLDTMGFIPFEKVLEDKTITQQFRGLNFETKLLFCYHLAYGFEILKSINYIHADINPQNFFINLSNGELAVIDFDSGAVTDNPNDKPDTFGKVAEADWLAPEISEQLANQTKTIPTIKVNLHTDTWSVAVGIHHLIFLQHPYFFLKDLGKDTIKKYLKSNKWCEIKQGDANFNANLNFSNYQKYVNLLENVVPKEIARAFKSTFNNGCFNPQNRVSYDQWTIALKQSQTPPIIDSFKPNKKVLVEGQEVTLSWSVRNVNRILINGSIDVTGKSEHTIQPKKTASYFIQAFNIFGDSISKKEEIEVIPMPKIEIAFPAPNFTISFNRQAVGTQLPDLNFMFPLEASKFTKVDERLLKPVNGFEVEHILRKRILRALGKAFFLVSIITISVVLGYYFALTSNHQ